MYKLHVVSTIIVSLLLSACGGGGGSGSTSLYVGSENAASITLDNAIELSNMTLNVAAGADSGGYTTTQEVKRLNITSNNKVLQTEQLDKDQVQYLLAAKVSKLYQSSNPSDNFSKQEVIDETVACDSGSYHASGNENPNGTSKVTLTFTNCQYSLSFLLPSAITYTFNGVLDVEVSDYDVATDTLTNFVFIYHGLSVSNISGEYIIEGRMQLLTDVVSDVDTYLFNKTEHHRGSNLYMKLENLSYVVKRDTVYNTVTATFDITSTGTLSGRVYISDYGFVETTTLEPLVFLSNSSSFYPTSGSLIIEGENKAKIKIDIANGNQTISVDADADDVYESVNTYPLQ